MEWTALIDESGEFGRRGEPAAVGGVLVPTAGVGAVSAAMLAGVELVDKNAPFILHYAWLSKLAFVVLARVAWQAARSGALPTGWDALCVVDEALRRLEPGLCASVTTDLSAGKWPKLDPEGAVQKLERTLRAEYNRGAGGIAAACDVAGGYRDHLQIGTIVAASKAAECLAFGAWAQAGSSLTPDRGSVRRHGGDDYLPLLELALERAADVAALRGAATLHAQVCTRRVRGGAGAGGLLTTREIARCAGGCAPAACLASPAVGRGDLDPVNYPRPGRSVLETHGAGELALYLADAAVNRFRLFASGNRALPPLGKVCGVLRGALPGHKLGTYDRSAKVVASHLACAGPPRARVRNGVWPPDHGTPPGSWPLQQAETW
jgi:hypothetical protein